MKKVVLTLFFIYLIILVLPLFFNACNNWWLVNMISLLLLIILFIDMILLIYLKFSVNKEIDPTKVASLKSAKKLAKIFFVLYIILCLINIFIFYFAASC